MICYEDARSVLFNKQVTYPDGHVCIKRWNSQHVVEWFTFKE